MNDSTIFKRCTKCRTEYPATLEFFHPQKKTRDGLHQHCRECDRQYARDRYASDPERFRKKTKDYVAKNKEKVRESQSVSRRTPEYREKSAAYQRERRKLPEVRERKNTRKRDRYANDPEYRQRILDARKTPEAKAIKNMKRRDRYANDPQFKEQSLIAGRVTRQRRMRENPNEVRAHGRMKIQRRRARKRNAEGSYTVEELQQQFQRQKGKCFYCGEKLKKGWHADHVIPLDKGGSNYITNIVCACPFCNDSKGNKLLHEWKGNGGRLL